MGLSFTGGKTGTPLWYLEMWERDGHSRQCSASDSECCEANFINEYEDDLTWSFYLGLPYCEYHKKEHECVALCGQASSDPDEKVMDVELVITERYQLDAFGSGVWRQAYMWNMTCRMCGRIWDTYGLHSGPHNTRWDFSGNPSGGGVT